MFIIAFTKARHLSSIQWHIRQIQFTLHPVSSRFVLSSFCHLRLGLPSGPFFHDSPPDLVHTYHPVRSPATLRTLIRTTSLNSWLTALFWKQMPLCGQQWELNRDVCMLGMGWNFIGKWLACIEYRISTSQQEGHSLQWYGHHYILVQNCLNRRYK